MKKLIIFLTSVLSLVQTITFAGNCSSSPIPGHIVLGGGGERGSENFALGNNIIAISGGGEQGLALRSDGSVAAWGYDRRGQVSNYPSGNDFIAVAAGNYHSSALRASGEVVAWGNNDHGQCDVPSSAQSGVVSLTAGSYVCMALKNDGTVVSWGMNSSLSEDRASGVQAVAMQGYRRMVLKNDNSVISWRVNGTTEAPPAGTFTFIAPCWYTYLAIKSDGSLAAWGDPENSPGGLNIPSGNDYVEIYGNDNYAMGRKTDGSIVCWGSPPGSLTGSGYTAMAAGRGHNFALMPGRSPDMALGDINGNTTVDWEDIQLFADDWPSSCAQYTGPDLNDDRKVDLRDFAILAGNWKASARVPSIYIYAAGENIDEGHVCNAVKDKYEEGRFLISRSGGNLAEPLTVGFELSGPATVYSPGQFVDDYTVKDSSGNYLLTNGQLQGVATIPAGRFCTPVKFYAVDDALVEGPEGVTISILPDPAYKIIRKSQDSIVINDYVTEGGASMCPDTGRCECDETAENEPSINVTVDNGSINENGSGQPGKLTFSTTGDTGAPFIVHYTVSGTATAGSDYTALSGSVLIPAGSSSASITLTAINDTAVEGLETVIVSVKTDATYAIGTPSQGTISIIDDDWTGPVMSVAATDATAEEGGSTGQFTITSTQSVSSMSVSYTVSGTATAGSDYTALSGSVVINGTTSTIMVTPLDDLMYEGDETVIVSLNSGSGYQVGTPTQATVTVKDNEPPTIWSDGFESGTSPDSTKWDKNGTVALTADAAYFGTKGVSLKMLAYIRSKSISTVGYHGIHVKYARKTNYTGAATEKMVVEWSLDNGSNWQPALESTADTAWAYKDWTLPSTADGKTTIKVRFSGGWDNSTKFAYVDGVEIAGTPN